MQGKFTLLQSRRRIAKAQPPLQPVNQSFASDAVPATASYSGSAKVSVPFKARPPELRSHSSDSRGLCGGKLGVLLVWGV